MRPFLKWITLVFVLAFLPVGELLASVRSQEVREFVRRVISQRLSPVGRTRIAQTQRAILELSDRHEIDPLLVIAIIEKESRFHPRKRGSHGEIGLMQVKPSTGRWIARRFRIPWGGPSTLEDPALNVRIGIAYLATLKKRFPREDLYLAAYNSGPAGLSRLLARKRFPPRRYSSLVLRHRKRLHIELARS